MMKNKHSYPSSAALFGASLALLVAACDDSDAPEEITLTEIAGSFVAPESAVWDPDNRVWYVASFGQDVGMDQQVPDAPGYISRVAADGTVLEERFVERDGDFLGMGILDGILYVGHGLDLIAVDLADGTVDTVGVPGAVFLNDVAVGNGAVYISDTVVNTIFRYEPGGQPEVFSQDPALIAPNGVFVDGDTLIVGTIGAFPPDPTKLGALYEVDATGTANRLGTLEGVFDGVEKVGDRYLVTEFNGPLYLVEPGTGDSELLVDVTEAPHGLASAADFGIDTATGSVLLTDLFGDKAFLFTLPDLDPR